jgi:hypothetical protein
MATEWIMAFTYDQLSSLLVSPVAADVLNVVAEQVSLGIRARPSRMDCSKGLWTTSCWATGCLKTPAMLGGKLLDRHRQSQLRS